MACRAGMTSITVCVCVCVCVVGYEDDLARSRKNKSSLCDMD